MRGPLRLLVGLRRRGRDRDRGRPWTRGNPVRHTTGDNSDCLNACGCSRLFRRERFFQRLALGDNDAQIVV